jgi:hypothetical protein
VFDRHFSACGARVLLDKERSTDPIVALLEAQSWPLGTLPSACCLDKERVVCQCMRPIQLGWSCCLRAPVVVAPGLCNVGKGGRVQDLPCFVPFECGVLARLRARVLWDMGGDFKTDPNQAKRHFEEATQEEGHAQAAAFAMLGKWQVQVGRSGAEARRCYQQAEAIDPNLTGEPLVQRVHAQIRFCISVSRSPCVRGGLVVLECQRAWQVRHACGYLLA